MQGIARIVDADPEGGKGLLRRMRDDVGCVQCPLLHLVNEIHGEIMVEGKSGVTKVSMLAAPARTTDFALQSLVDIGT